MSGRKLFGNVLEGKGTPSLLVFSSGENFSNGLTYGQFGRDTTDIESLVEHQLFDTLIIKRLTLSIGTNSTSGISHVALRRNGVTIADSLVSVPPSTTGVFTTGFIMAKWNPNDFIAIEVFKSSGGQFSNLTVWCEIQ